MNVCGDSQIWSGNWDVGVWVLFLLGSLQAETQVSTGLSIVMLFCPEEGEVVQSETGRLRLVLLLAQPDTRSSKVIISSLKLGKFVCMLLR